MLPQEDRELHRYAISFHDFEKSISFLDGAKEFARDSLAREALLICAIIYYYRPFSPNEKERDSGAISQIDLSLFNLSLAEDALHRHCKLLRNKALAHAESSTHPTAYNRDSKLFSSRRYSVLGDPINWDELRALAEKMMDHCGGILSHATSRP